MYPQSVHPYLHFFNTLFKRFQILGLVLMAHAVFQPLAGLFKAPDIKREGLLLRTVTRATVILILGEYLIDLRMGLNIYREYPISWQLYLPSVWIVTDSYNSDDNEDPDDRDDLDDHGNGCPFLHTCATSVETRSPFQEGACCMGWPRLLVHQ